MADDGRLVLGDFGLVFPREEAGSRVTSTQEKVGTTDWMPTWTIGNKRLEEVRPTFDVFALGKLLWALIAGDSYLRLHHFADDEFNLEKRFPRDKQMKIVNEVVLSRCLVEKEALCLENASQLLAETQRLVEALEAHTALARADGKDASDARDSMDGVHSVDATRAPTKQAIPAETLTISVGQTKSAFGDGVFVTLIAIDAAGTGRCRLTASVGSTGIPTKSLNHADVGDTLVYEGFEVRIMSASYVAATFRVAQLPPPF